MSQSRHLIPTGTAREAVRAASTEEGRGPRRALPQDFPRDLLEGASQWEEGPELLHLAWELSTCAPQATARQRRALLLLAFCALLSGREGSTRLPVLGRLGKSHLKAKLEELGATRADVEAVTSLCAEVPAPLAHLVGSFEAHCPLVLEGEWLALERMRRAEDGLASALRARLEQKPLLPEKSAKKALDEVLASAPQQGARKVQLSPEQQAAVVAAVCRPLTVITGGPGTGKTSIVVSVLRTLVRLGVPPESIALAAPTGKAAMRMEESVLAALRTVPERSLEDELLLKAPPPARTLHRLLGYSPTTDRFLHHALNPLAEQVVVVDESSMVDLFLMDRLLKAVRPEGRLVLLGDADQLPSVDAGAVFRDLVPEEGASTRGDVRRQAAVRLTQSYRMDPSDPAGRNILTVARGVKAGEAPEVADAGEAGEGGVALRPTAGEVRFSHLELLACQAGDATQRAFLERWEAEVLRGAGEVERLVRREYRFGAQGCVEEDREELSRLFRVFESARLLCLTRSESSPWGTGALNAFFHARALAAWRSASRGALVQSPEFLPGEPVLVVRNDYGRGLYNGDGGVVVRGVDESGDGKQHFLAAFRSGEGFVAFPVEGLRGRLTHAYAMTVHKSQGSEFEKVALVLPGRDSPLLTRELLYTGMTRAKKSVVLVGDAEMLRLGVARAQSRYSALAERLRAGTAAQRAEKSGS